MTATNHMMTGALIAAVVRQPAFALPLAFVSHFVLDVLPHYGYGDIPREHRDKQKNFILKQALDIYPAVGLMLLVPFVLRFQQYPIVTVLSMLMAFIPDGIWAIHYVVAHRSGSYRELSKFNRFHKAIQWCERPWGIYFELLYFGAVTALMLSIAS